MNFTLIQAAIFYLIILTESKSTNLLANTVFVQLIRISLESSLNIVTTELVHFDSDLPRYKTKDGVYRDLTVNGRIVSPTIMWVEALNLILHKLSSTNFDFKKVIAFSGSGQQHDNVFWQKGSSQILTSLDPNKSLKDQLQNAFSVK
ncbi:unnamed protein product [Eruca vesicaria subsp. sativa]|uniref:Uncharacterized protein n=1 Tax=Eruca vesicaria subsp. sativa TaxID=29727 RepID=A0ABC8J1A5_ERUVS|nr:unnamed protein product [Eruca vesicaria subsp. sativa]